MAQIDAKAAQFDLPVLPPEKGQRAILAPGGAIPGAIDPGRTRPCRQQRHRGARIGAKTAGRGLGARDIAITDRKPSDPQISRHPGRRQAAIRSQHIGQRMGNRPADRDVLQRIHRPTRIKKRAGDRGLGRPIPIEPAHIGHHRLPARQRLCIDLFAPRNHQPHRGRQAVAAFGHAVTQHMPKGGGQVQHADLQRAHPLQKLQRRRQHVCIPQDDTAPRQKAGQDLFDRDIKGEAGKLQHPVLIAQVELCRDGQRMGHQRPHRHFDPFGFAGRAGGVDHIGQPRRVRIRQHGGRGLSVPARLATWLIARLIIWSTVCLMGPFQGGPLRRHPGHIAQDRVVFAHIRV